MQNDQDNPTAAEAAGLAASQSDQGDGAVVGSIAPAADTPAPEAIPPELVEGLKEAAAGLTAEAAAAAPKPETTVAQDIAAHANIYRKGIKAIAQGVKGFHLAVSGLEAVPGGDQGEVAANISLAYRHLEDASQRLGKAIQAADGGVSVYDRETTVGA